MKKYVIFIKEKDLKKACCSLSLLAARCVERSRRNKGFNAIVVRDRKS